MEAARVGVSWVLDRQWFPFLQLMVEWGRKKKLCLMCDFRASLCTWTFLWSLCDKESLGSRARMERGCRDRGDLFKWDLEKDFWKTIYLLVSVWMAELQKTKEWERESELPSLSSFTPEMAPMTRAGLVWNWEPRVASRLHRWVQRHSLEHPLLLSQVH